VDLQVPLDGQIDAAHFFVNVGYLTHDFRLVAQDGMQFHETFHCFLIEAHAPIGQAQVEHGFHTRSVVIDSSQESVPAFGEFIALHQTIAPANERCSVIRIRIARYIRVLNSLLVIPLLMTCRLKHLYLNDDKRRTK